MSDTRLRMPCPNCGYQSLALALDIPVCQRKACDWAGNRPIDPEAMA